MTDSLRWLMDTNIFLYARGGEHPYRDPCRVLLGQVRQARLQPTASVELVQEFLHVLLRRRIDRPTALEEAADVGRQCRLQAFDRDTLRLAMRLMRENERVGPRDAVHAATALSHDIPVVVSADRVFDHVDGLRRLDPTVAAAELA